MIEYFGDLALRVPVPTPLLNQLTLHLYDMARQFPAATAKHSRHIISERQKLFSLYSQSKNGRGVWPFLDLVGVKKPDLRLFVGCWFTLIACL